MTLAFRGNPGKLRGPFSFLFSACVHAGLLAWLVVAGEWAAEEKAQSLYDMEIRPHESHLIWYNLHDKLPEVRPSATPAAAKPQRALRQFNQEIAVGPKELPKPPQLIQTPAPEIALAKPLPLPNVLAASVPPRPVRAFMPPPDRAAPQPVAPKPLPDAPRLTAEAPRELSVDLAGSRPKPLPFLPPEARKTQPALPVLPAAPEIATGGGAPEMPRIPRGFTPPAAARSAAPAAAEVMLAPDAAGVVDPSAGAVSNASLAIVGLNPANTLKLPELPGSHTAGFSGGPEKRPEGSDSSPGDARLVVPGVSARGGSRDTQPTLVAALAPLTREHMAAMTTAAAAPALRTPAAERNAGTRVSNAPDPRLEGRIVYAVAIQMPNITSYSGSWLAWYAEHQPVPGAPPVEIHPPSPLRKVDPKYIQSAADEKVQGTIRLFAVIRKTGSVDSVELLQGLDPRLDRSAQEALVKWQFDPAMRNGTPVDVDAVFDIPFRLAPRFTK